MPVTAALNWLMYLSCLETVKASMTWLLVNTSSFLISHHDKIVMSIFFSLHNYLIVICGHPFQDRVSVDNNSTIIEGYMDPALEGAVLSFDCPPQHVLIGPNTTTCMGNGEWEPDPMEVECKGIMLC